MRKSIKFLTLPLTLVFLVSFIISAVSILPIAADVNDNLVAYYKFDSDLKDYSGNNNDGTQAGGNITFAKGIVGNGAKFDGSTYIEVNDSDSLDTNTAFTISLWLYKDSAGKDGYAPVLSRGDSTENSEYTPYALYHSRDGYNTTLKLTNTSNWEELGCNTQVSHQKWHLLTVTFNTKEAKFYIDGVFKNKQTWNYGELFNTDQKLIIGAIPSDGGMMFKGIMDELRIYKTALSDGEIKALYDTTKIVTPPAPTVLTVPASGTTAYVDTVSKDALIAHYKFDADTKDYSGNSNDGAIQGKTDFADSMLGKGVRLDGATYIEVNDSDYLDTPANFTISSWIYKDGAGKDGYAPILSRGDNTESSEYTPYALYHSRDGYNPTLKLTNTSNWEELGCNTQVSHQKWHLLTVTFNTKEAKFYIDGVFKNKQTWNYGELFNTDQKLIIGAIPPDGGMMFKGIIDDLRIYGRTLADKEIKTLYEDVMKTKDQKGKLVAHYKFDKDIKDYSGNNNNGEEAAGSITFLKGMVGNGASFDGSSYIEVPDNDTIDFNKAFTISTYLYKDSNEDESYTPVLSRGDSSQQSEFTPFALIHDREGYYPMLKLINTSNWEDISCSTQVGMKKWHLLTVTFDSKEVKFYIDGVFKSKQTWKYGELFHTNQSMLIGCDPIGDTKMYKGVIDELKLYNYALTDAEVKALNATKNGTITAVVDNNKYKALTVVPDKLATIKVSQTLTLKVTGTTTLGKAIDVTAWAAYKSDNDKIAKIENGKLTGVAKGTTNVSIIYGGFTKSIKVTVK